MANFLEMQMFGHGLLVQYVRVDLRVLALRLTAVLLVMAALATLVH